MTLAAGTRLGPYEILAPLGAGGMGEVWKAKDSRLERMVALKVLPQEFFEDKERVARFEREAKLLAALNHSGIAAIHSFEEISGRHILIMELVEGDGLDTKIAAGSLPLEESLSVARQIAEALEAAHEKGIVHRDLKPANVKVSVDGKVKILDFGLAKMFETEAGSSPDLSLSPTLTAQATAMGVILGTAAYMSPEQARGRPVDKRADVWAFAVVLFEMLTGRRLFEGETISDVLASVLRHEPDWTLLPKETPQGIRNLLRKCLVRDPRQRLHDIGDARLELEEAAALPAGSSSSPFPAVPGGSPAPAPAWRRVLLPVATGVLLLATAVLGFLLFRASHREARVVRATINPPAGTAFVNETTQPGPVAISPDGRRIVFSARSSDGRIRLYVRPLDAADAYVLTGTEGAQYPFWSPDSRSIGFSADQKLKRIDASGGPPITLCAASDFAKGGAWSPTGVIVFAPGATGPLYRVSENGGESTAITKLDAKRSDNSHRLPFFLPDGRHFLFLARITNASATEGHPILVGSVDGGEERLLLRSPAAAEYASGHLLFLRDRVLMAQPFDAGKATLKGEARPIAEKVRVTSGAAKAIFSVSQNGILILEIGDDFLVTSRLEWIDRSGKVLGTLGDLASYGELSLSPDGKSAAVSILDDKAGTFDLWIYDVERNLRTRFTFDPGNENSPRWSPDGKTIAFSSNKAQHQDLCRKSVEGSGEEELLYASEPFKRPTGFSPDGKLLAFLQFEPETGVDIWILPMTGEKKPSVFLKTKFNEGQGVFSPDGRWLAYNSNESGRPEVYVTPFPGPGRRWQVSTGGGTYPRWRQQGKEIVYQEETGRVVSVEVSIRGETPVFGAATPLFTGTPSLLGLGMRLDATADAKRFLMIKPTETKETGSLTLVLNWPQELQRR